MRVPAVHRLTGLMVVLTLAGCASGTSTTGVASSAAAPTSTPGPAPAASGPSGPTLTGRFVIVRGTVGESMLRRVRAEGDLAAERVQQVWGDVWKHRLPVQIEVPSTQAQFRAWGGGGGGDIAATATLAGRVVLNPELPDRVTRAGQVVVLTHELTHIALHQASAQARGVPRWVTEGSAELTAYRPTGLTLGQAAPQVAQQVRRGAAPAGPPADGAFGGPDAERAYQQAYVWCAFLVDRYGLQRFTRFIRAADAGGVGAFPRHFDIAVGALAAPFRAWQRSELAARPGPAATGSARSAG